METLIEKLFALPDGALTAGDEWTLTFANSYGGTVKLLLIVAFLVLAGLTIYNYRREGHAHGAVKGLLAGLRIAVYGLLLLCLLRPAIVVTDTRTLRRTVILLFDKSYSMNHRDAYRGTTQADPLAQALGVSPDELATLSRMDIVRKLMSDPDGPGRVLSEHHVLVMAYGRGQNDSAGYTRILGQIVPGEDGPTTRPVGSELADLLSGVRADGLETDHAAAVWDALREGRGRRLASIVMIGDGQNTAAGNTERMALAIEQARRQRVSIVAGCAGDPTVPEKVTDVVLEAPAEIRPDGEAELTVRIHHRNCGGKEATVQLLRRAGPDEPWKPAAEPIVRVLAAADEAPADGDVERGSETVVIRPNAELAKAEDYSVEYKVTVALGPATVESLAAKVLVSDRKINVLVIAGDGGWELQRLKDVLYRSPDRYRTSVWQQSADPDVNQAASSGMKITQLPRTLEELMGSAGGKPHPGYQVVVCYDPKPTTGGFDKEFVNNLNLFVTKHGGGLCYIAGNKYTESLVVSEGRWEKLASLLPVELSRNPVNYAAMVSEERPVPRRFQLTLHGVDHPVMRLADSVDRSREAWSLLPGTYWSYPVYRLKPIARMLAGRNVPQAAAGQLEPVIAAMPAGGRVLYVGSDETWRWLFVDGGAYYRRFWHNAMRYLAPQTRVKRVVIATEGEQFLQTEKITISADVYDREFKPVVTADGTYPIDLIDVTTGARRVLSLRAVDPKTRPGEYRATVLPPEPGTYRLTALTDDPLADEKVASRRIVIRPPDAETRRTEADPAALAAIAEGRAAPIHRLEEQLAKIPGGKIVTHRPETYTIWDSYVTLVLLVLLLAAEWIVRKRVNMT